ncbi:MAG TPA: glycosyltransferase family 4 protein [Gemmatimonadaceae bacterium]|nr:glycosyltransferase family 4 protein [Gemmatimonadaceae bacterium]
MAGKTFLFLSQVYVPDPAAVGQHLADVAEELARRGHKVTVLTANRGYDDPSQKYPGRETIRGVDVRRIPLSSFGKSSIAIRTAGGFLFVLQAILRSVLVRNVDAVVVSTSPPMGSLAAVVIGMLHRARVKYWVMDVNPDQLVTLGLMNEKALPIRVFNGLNRLILRQADDVIVLDRFMAERIKRKTDIGDKVSVLPPWPPEDFDTIPNHGDNPFRKQHDLNGKIVVMYSGNHGPSNPLTTIIEAAKRVVGDPRMLFLFVGGGIGKREVESAGSPNIVSLPYQPQSELRESLSAADVHVVSVGNDSPGIVHPSKVYGAMAAARPILLIGPEQSHIADILDEHDIGWHVRHGDVDGAVQILREIAAAPPDVLRAKGQRAYDVIRSMGGKAQACARVCDVLERGI